MHDIASMALPNHTMSAQQTLYTSNGNYVTESDESELVEVPKPTEFVYEGDSYWTEPEVFDTSEPEAIVNNTDTWFDERNTTLPIRKELVLPGEPTCRVAVEASHYLQLFIDHSPTNEPLLSALGGFPLALKLHIESNLAQWKAANLEPFFVFEGMSTIDREEKELKNAKEATVLTNKAWSLYTDNKATAAVTAFGRSAAIKAKKFVRFFQNILSEQGIEYLVAPYSACAQIAYLDSLSSDTKTQFIDAIMGSYELLLFKVDSVITKINFEDSTFNFISKKSLMDQLNTSEDTFVDALLCTGMYGIPPFPALTEGKTLPENEPGYSAKAAVLLIKSSGRTVGKMCETLVDKMTHPDWEAKYQKAKMAIKHNIVLHASGRVFVAEYDQLTADNAEYLGLQLPEELLYYLGKGAISPRILNWMGSLEMLVHPPLDGGESEEFKKLVSEQLVPIRAQTVALLASRLNRAYQHKNITMKFWYEGSKPVIMNPPNQITPKPSDVASSWCVKESQYKDVKNTAGAKPGSFTFALRSLTDSKFAASTTQKLPDAKLTTDDEISCNTIWRFLHLREYLNDKHELTVWGRALLAALEKAESAHNLEESVVLALELIRHDQLNTRNIYEDLIGGPLRGSDEEKADCLLISRVACLAKIQHKFIGYTGPLSRNLLTFHSLTTGVRECNRDLMETILVSILLNYEAERGPQRSYAVLSLRLPFWNDVDCALGIAVKTYLDDFAAPGQSLELKREKKSIYANQLIPHNLDFAADLDVAFQLFDAVYAAVQTLKDEVPDKSGWERANRYLTLRR